MSIISRLSLSLSLLGKFWQEKINAQLFRWNLALILLQFLYLFLRFNDLPPQIPLFYSHPWGELQLVTPNWLFVLPIFSITFWLLNNLLSAFYLSRVQLLSRLLVIFSLIFSFLATVCLFQIINIVG